MASGSRRRDRKRFLLIGSMRGVMLFGSRKRPRPAGGVSHPNRPSPSQTAEPELVPWRVWRSAAQKATRAWNEWLAADALARPELYRRYVSALAEEEQAAIAIERSVNLDGLELASEHQRPRPASTRT
jgi:hypothetical protein